MTARERNDMKQMRKYSDRVRFWLDIRNDSSENLIKARDILEDVEAKCALIRDAVVYYINSDDFDIEDYRGPGHRRVRE